MQARKPESLSAVQPIRTLHTDMCFSVIVPAYNEVENLVLFIPTLHQYLINMLPSGVQQQLIVVDDGSTDNSIEQLRAILPQYPLEIIELSRNFGKEYAVTAGIEVAYGDVVLLIDADFQHPIAMIEQMFQLWQIGYDMVYGIRNRVGESVLKRWLTRRFYWLLNQGANVNIPMDAGDFRLLDARVVASLNALPEHTRYMKGLFAWVGYKSVGVHFDEGTRTLGNSSFSFWRLFELAMRALTAFSDAPLRVCSIAGIFLALISFLYGAHIIIDTLFEGIHTPGWATLIVAITFLGGIQLIAIGVLGEYIARIYNEVKNRPNYIIARKHQSQMLIKPKDITKR